MRRVDVLRRHRTDTVAVRNATVTAASAGRVSISIDGATITDVPHLGNMTPQPGHVVKVLTTGRSMLVIGSLNPDAYGGP